VLLFCAWALAPPRWVMSLAWVSSLFFGGALVLMIALRYRARELIGGAKTVLRLLRLHALGARIEVPLASFADGLAAVSSAGKMIRLLGMTVVIWGTEAMLVWGLALAFGMAVPPRSAVVVAAVLGLGLMIPAAPGGLGTYELAGVAAFQLVGAPASGALAVTLVIHAWVALTNVTLGLGLLAARGMRFAQIKEDLQANQTAD